MPYYYKYDPSFVEMEVLFIRTLQFILMRLVCRLLCGAIMKKAPCYYKKDISSMLMEGLFSRTSLLASLCAWCGVCFLKQTREECLINIKTTNRLLNIEDFLSEHFSFFFDALGVCRYLCNAVKKRHITIKKTYHPS